MKSMEQAEQAEKVRENRLRRMAERQGLKLVKSRTRDYLAQDYGLYWVVDPLGEPGANDPAFPFEGCPAHRFPWQGEDLDGVEEFLSTPHEDR